MQDGHTRRQRRPEPPPSEPRFLREYRACLVIVEGPRSGTELALDRPRVEMGRGPGVELRFEDDAMSREHACFEVVEGALRVRDLGSTNGVFLNDHPTLAAELKHGDQLQIGNHVFRYLVERLETPAPAHQLPDE
jgi:pSer/pThr/pTyr-binding forkhead associated (FHA) protein